MSPWNLRFNPTVTVGHYMFAHSNSDTKKFSLSSPAALNSSCLMFIFNLNVSKVFRAPCLAVTNNVLTSRGLEAGASPGCRSCRTPVWCGSCVTSPLCRGTSGWWAQWPHCPASLSPSSWWPGGTTVSRTTSLLTISLSPTWRTVALNPPRSGLNIDIINCPLLT